MRIFIILYFNPILHTAWLNNHALTLKRNIAIYYFSEKSSFLHTFLKISFESRKIEVKLIKKVILNNNENDQGRKGPCFFQRLIALKCLRCQKIQTKYLSRLRMAIL